MKVATLKITSQKPLKSPFSILHRSQNRLRCHATQHHRLNRFPQPPQTTTAKDVALAYYTNYNDKNIAAVLDLIADECIYEDLVYQDPFVGKQQIAVYFNKLGGILPQDIKFVVEDITDGDPMCVGVTWHVEIGDGIVFPFSRGTSFYRINDQGKIVFARDIVEPSIKPGSAALQGIQVLAPLVRTLGPAADPANLKYLPLAKYAMFGFWSSYIVYVMLSPSAPGLPVWQTNMDTIQSVLNESYNFFYVNIIAAEFGLNPVPCVAENPVSEALFNFVNAWSMMFLPMMLVDPLGRDADGGGSGGESNSTTERPKKIKDIESKKIPLWLGTMFLTNVFFPIYLALRLAPTEKMPTKAPTNAELYKKQLEAKSYHDAVSYPGWFKLLGATAGVVGLTSVIWALAARPEYGGLLDRWTYLTTQLSTDRVFWAFGVDACLYSVWQAWLLGDIPTASNAQRFVPFFGAVSWLLTAASSGGDTEQDN